MLLVAAILLAAYVVPLPWSIAVVAVGLVLEVGEAVFWWRLSHRGGPKVGVEALVGQRATVVEPCRPRGQVRVAGELWQATCSAGADPGDVLRVVAVDGGSLTLTVAA